MAKVVQLAGHRPGGWAKARWDWLKRVRRNADLPVMARLVAHSLAIGYANAETAECRPGAKALAADCGTSVRTIERAMNDLEQAGWIERLGGNAPGVLAAIRFRVPGEHPPEMAAEHPPEMTGEHPPTLAATPAISCAPPRPPYMDQPNMNQNTRGNRWPRSATKIITPGGARPSPQLSKIVAFNSPEAGEWDEYLAAKGFRPLAEIGIKGGPGMLEGWDLPFSRPPRADRDPIDKAIALKFAEWLRARS